MTEYRFHLQKYRPGSKTVCPECGRKACFTRYIDEAGEISFPDSVGMCDHINSCGYHYTPKEYFRDNPAVKERLNGQERFGGTPIAARPPARALPEQKPRISFLPSDWVEQSMRRYDIKQVRHQPLVPILYQSDGQGECGQAIQPIQGRYLKEVGRCDRILADRPEQQRACGQDLTKSAGCIP